MSAVSSYFMKEEAPTVKTLSRDFILGSILVLFIMQILPDSVTKLMTLLMSLFVFKSSASGGGNIIGDIATAIGDTATTLSTVSSTSNEVEVRVGVPRF
jgi:hypothetical protein